jgi:hypothetical protein
MGNGDSVIVIGQSPITKPTLREVRFIFEYVKKRFAEAYLEVSSKILPRPHPVH